MYRIQSSLKRNLMDVLRGVKLKKTLAATRLASSEIYAPQYFNSPKKKSVMVSSIFCQLNCLWTFAIVTAFVPTCR